MGVGFSVKISNLGNIIAGLNKLAVALPEKTRHDVYETLEAARETYYGGEPGGYSVPERAGQAYARTGNLGAGMYVVQDGATSRYTVEAGYAGYVIGNSDGTGGAWMHAGRWPNLRLTILKFVNERLVDKLNSTIEQLIRAYGLA